MHRPTACLLLVACLAAAPAAALAQAEAKQAFADGKAAFAQDDFEKARALFLKASQTDNRNPEVFLWLGKAHYQLGGVEEAMAAWRRTLQLAPDEPYAAKMLKALAGQLTKASTRIRIIEILVQKGWAFQAASRQCRELLKDEALTNVQRAQVMLLLARSLLPANKPAEAIALVREVMLRYPKEADAGQTALLLAQIKLRTGEGDEGVALLKKVVADHAGTPAAAEAAYELLRLQLDQPPELATARALEKWIAANPDHPRAREAREKLVAAYLAVSNQGPPPAPDAGLSEPDKAALAAAGELYKRMVQAGDARLLTQKILTHLDRRHFRHKAYAAAAAGVDLLLQAPLPPSSRSLALRALAKYRAEHAIAVLTEQAKAAKALGAGMPQVLADVLTVYSQINRAFPAQPAWADQAALAERVRTIAALVPWPAKVTAPKPPMAWAVEIALAVVQANRDAHAVQQAVATLAAIVDECARLRRWPPGSEGIALPIHTRLVSALSPEHGAWPSVCLKHIDLLGAQATRVFSENLRAGRAEDNAKINDYQKQLLATMARLVARQASYAPTVLKRLEAHLQPWVGHGHYDVAQAAHEQLAGALPEAQRRAVDLAVARLWVRQVVTEHARLLSAGLTVPRRLDPTLVKALQRCYSLQGGLDETDPFVTEIRGVWEAVVNHYKALEYFDVAEQAIKTKAAQAVVQADAYAQLRLADLHAEQARRALARFLADYQAAEKITLTPAFQAAIDEYTQFISDHPTSLLLDKAVAGVFRIAQLFEQHQAYDVAVGVYREFAAFAAKVKALGQAAPGAASQAERAEFAAAAALYAKAVRALNKLMAEAQAQAAPPAKISAEFTAAVGAYKDFIKAHPDSALLGEAIRQTMRVALEYAKVNSWDVAEGIYADLLAGGLAIRRPERLEFARGLCHLGKVMPDHARQVLRAITLAPPPATVSALLGWGRDDWVDANGAALPRSGMSGRPVPTARPPQTSPAGAAQPTERSALRAFRGPRMDLSRAAEPDDEKLAEGDLLAMAEIRQQQQRRAAQVAQLRGGLTYSHGDLRQTKDQIAQRALAAPVLSDAEIARQEAALAAAYKIFQGIRKNYADKPAAQQARGEVLIMINHWRTLAKWRRAAALAEQYLADNPADAELPQLRLGIARDTLSWAAQPVEKQESTQAMLAEVAKRFTEARTRLAAIVKDFPKEKNIVHQAQWDIANSFLTQARVVDAFSPTLARGQYVRAAKELQQVAARYHDHPNIATVPQMLWNIAEELFARRYYDEAVNIWSELTIHYPTHTLAQQAAQRIAQTYQNNLRRPLLAAEAYLELNFARGGSDVGVQNQIYQIGLSLKKEERWVEALHVLEVFVDSFPRHPNAGQALTMVGYIHQANEAWKDAIAAYRRVINEFPTGAWVREAKWSIAECTISLSQWRQATSAYRSYLASYAKDARTAEANRRIGILKDLARYQGLVDEPGQRKAFDAQYQIAEILLEKLANPVKAIIEYRQVPARWAQSHLADDALFKVGTSYLSMGNTKKAREALLEMATKYPTSPLADDAMYMVGQSFENEATQLAGVTRKKTVELAQRKAQKAAYQKFSGARRQLASEIQDRISKLKEAGKKDLASLEEARAAFQHGQSDIANVELLAGQAVQQAEQLTASELADRQDKINAALRKAVDAYLKASRVAAADKADESLLRMAVIYADRLKDSEAAMATYLEIVRQFSGTAVAEDASWRIAQYYERQGKYAEAIKGFEAFLRNYRRSPRAGDAQFAIAENYEQLGQWVKAMDAYTNYINNFPSGPLVQKAKEQINWIKTYRL